MLIFAKNGVAENMQRQRAFGRGRGLALFDERDESVALGLHAREKLRFAFGETAGDDLVLPIPRGSPSFVKKAAR